MMRPEQRSSYKTAIHMEVEYNVKMKTMNWVLSQHSFFSFSFFLPFLVFHSPLCCSFFTTSFVFSQNVQEIILETFQLFILPSPFDIFLSYLFSWLSTFSLSLYSTVSHFRSYYFSSIPCIVVTSNVDSLCLPSVPSSRRFLWVLRSFIFKVTVIASNI